MQLYQFKKIYSQMEKEFGKIKRGSEEQYLLLLLSMEGNALKIHRKFPNATSRKMKEAIALVLFDIKENYTGEKYDTNDFRNENNEKLEKALLMAFDPITNADVMNTLKKELSVETLTSDILKNYYKYPIMCLLRINDSIEFWEKRSGFNGYFQFLEKNMGHKIAGEKMNFTIMGVE